LQAIDLGIPASVVLYAIDAANGKVTLKTKLVIIFFIVLYLVAGSRYRIFCLLLGLGAVWFLADPRKYKIIAMGGLAALVVPIAGILAIVRSYRAGINFEVLGGVTLSDIISRGFNEASSTVALGAVIETVPRVIDYPGLAPIWVALAQPIPRALWPDKPMPDYLLAIPASLGPGAEFFGLALPLAGEFYLIGGYLIVFAGAALVFFLIDKGFTRALVRGDMPAAAAIFLFVPTLLSRGYLAQALSSFAFLVLPVFLILRQSSKAWHRRYAIRMRRAYITSRRSRDG
jgi:hypothetical protein